MKNHIKPESKMTNTIVNHISIINKIINSSQGFEYRYIKINLVESIKHMDISADDIDNLVTKIIVYDILERSHLACLCSAARSMRWLESVAASIQQNNYLSFSASLRGLLESAADSYDLFNHLPSTIVNYGPYFNYIITHEDLSDLNPKIDLSALESLLIHFSFAEKQPKNKAIDSNLHAKTNTEYINNFQKNIQASGALGLYSTLCQITHPATPSLSCFYKELEATIEIDFKREGILIEEIMQQNESTIDNLLIFSINPIIITLNALRNIYPSFPKIDVAAFSYPDNIAKKIAAMDEKIAVISNKKINKKNLDLLKFLVSM